MNRHEVIGKARELLDKELELRYGDDPLLDRVEGAMAELRLNQVTQTTIELFNLIAEQSVSAMQACDDPILSDDTKFDRSLSDYHCKGANEFYQISEELGKLV